MYLVCRTFLKKAKKNVGTAEQKGARHKIFFLEKSTLSAYCADMAACGLSEAIQSIPPELREIILKEFIALKIKEKKRNGVD